MRSTWSAWTRFARSGSPASIPAHSRWPGRPSSSREMCASSLCCAPRGLRENPRPCFRARGPPRGRSAAPAAHSGAARRLTCTGGSVTCPAVPYAVCPISTFGSLFSRSSRHSCLGRLPEGRQVRRSRVRVLCPGAPARPGRGAGRGAEGAAAGRLARPGDAAWRSLVTTKCCLKCSAVRLMAGPAERCRTQTERRTDPRMPCRPSRCLDRRVNACCSRCNVSLRDGTSIDARV